MSTSESQTNLTAKLGPVLFLLAILLSPLEFNGYVIAGL